VLLVWELRAAVALSHFNNYRAGERIYVDLKAIDCAIPFVTEKELVASDSREYIRKYSARCLRRHLRDWKNLREKLLRG
jgi:hypothetical protein